MTAAERPRPRPSRSDVRRALEALQAQIDAAPDEDTRTMLRERQAATRARMNAARYAR